MASIDAANCIPAAAAAADAPGECHHQNCICTDSLDVHEPAEATDCLVVDLTDEASCMPPAAALGVVQVRLRLLLEEKLCNDACKLL